MNRILVLSAATAVLALGACTSAGGNGPAPITPTERYRLQAEEQPAHIALAAHPDGLSDNQRGAVWSFAEDWSAEGSGPILISAPSDGGEAASRTAYAAKQALVARGVDPAAIQVVAYQPEQAGGPVIVSYSRTVAVVPKCNQSWTNLTATRKNETQQNFGCAITANMAAQLENGADVRHPRTLGPADASRRDTVFGKYRNGEPTEAKSDDKTAGKVSTAVSN